MKKRYIDKIEYKHFLSLPKVKQNLINQIRGIRKEESWRRNHKGGIIKEESWSKNHGGGIMKEESWRVKHVKGITEEKS